MEKLNILGTGCAMTLDCYNTCFTIENNDGEHILVYIGGGLQIIKQLRDAKIDFRKIRNFNGNIYVPDDLDVIEL